MPDFVISEFGGINTRKEDPANGVNLPTKIAKNVDLRGGIIKPFRSDLAIKDGVSGELAIYGDDLIHGKENPVVFTINGFEILVYKDGGEWKRAVRRPAGRLAEAYTVDSLSQATPGSPTVKALPGDPTKVKAEPATEGWFYEMVYAVTFVRDAGGYIDESAPSVFVSARNEQMAFQIVRPLLSGANSIVRWNIYRLSVGYRDTASFQKVAEVSVGLDSYDDYNLGSELAGTYKGLFSSDGVTVLRQPAPVEFDGICPTLHYGQLVGWKDEMIFVSEPNQPESFPAQYQIPCSERIVSVQSYQGDLYAFTLNGVQRIIGSDPINVTIIPGYIGYRASSRRATVATENGLFYAFRNGIGVISSGQSQSITRGLLDPEYFDQIDPDSVHLAYGDGILYLFHSAGCLLFIQERGIGFVELTKIYEGAVYDRKNGVMVAAREGRAWEMWKGEGTTTAQYKQGGLVLNQPDDKRFSEIRVYGTGQFELVIYIEGIERSRRVLNLEGMLRDRIMRFPAGHTGREASWMLTGTGKVTEIKAVLT